MFDCYATSDGSGKLWLNRCNRRRVGDRVGLLVEGGRLWAFVDGVQLGPDPITSGLPARVRFFAELVEAGQRVRLVRGPLWAAVKALAVRGPHAKG
jgi:hypothetical protein